MPTDRPVGSSVSFRNVRVSAVSLLSCVAEVNHGELSGFIRCGMFNRKAAARVAKVGNRVLCNPL